VDYESRRLDPEGQSFIFRAELPGTYGLKFYKQDFIRDYILNDHVQVIVGEAPDASGAGWFNPPVDRGRVVAEPRWPELSAPREAESSPEAPAAADFGPPEAEPAAAVQGSPPDLSGQAEFQDQPPEQAGLPGEMPPAEYVRRSREEYDAGRIAGALAILDQFKEYYPAGSDEAWWLYGQILEAQSPSRDIRSALDYYRRLVREYPQSSRYDDARRRIAYLERYYFNIQ
jgi:tetratricopeptide (TPR) repeat protein